MRIKRWVIDAPCNHQYEECDEGEWCKWDDVSAELMKLDDALRAAKLDAEEWHVAAVAEGKAKLRAEGELRMQERATQQLSAEVTRLEALRG